VKGLRILFSIALPLIVLCGCAADIGYLWKQGGYLLKYGSGAQKIEKLLADIGTPEDTRRFLSLVSEIKRFAVERIGLKENQNYTQYKELDRDYIADVVQACDAVSFSPYYWNYPFLGKLPYKGFYESADAEAEADRLRKEGYDVIVRKVDAFSTLGFFPDHVYSFMERYSPFDLANLIIHEQTHATVFLQGQSQFNEELAGFVGEEGALEFLRGRYGIDSAVYREAVSGIADSEIFLGFLKRLRGALEAVYEEQISRDEKLERKKELIAAAKREFIAEVVTLFKTEEYRASGEPAINNAYISLYDLYTGDALLLRRYFSAMCGSDLAGFMRRITLLAKSGGDVRESMRKELDSAVEPESAGGA
jgi:predicted aminopeptidase